MSAAPASTSVVIVAADSGADLARGVAALLASTAPLEIIVADNASRDGSVDALEARWRDEPRLRILRTGANLGFGAGCNRAAAQARGDALLLLNPDCCVEPDTLARLRALLDADATLGLVGARIVGDDGKLEPASRRRDPLLRRALMSMSGLSRWEGRWPALAGVDYPDANARAPAPPALEDVDAVSGALMLLRTDVFRRLGGFDERYFLHCEDLDLCRRVRDAGLRVACANAVSVRHSKGTSSRARPFFVARHKHRGMWRWFRKFDPAARNPLTCALVWFGLWAHYALSAPRYAWALLRAR